MFGVTFQGDFLPHLGLNSASRIGKKDRHELSNTLDVNGFLPPVSIAST